MTNSMKEKFPSTRCIIDCKSLSVMGSWNQIISVCEILSHFQDIVLKEYLMFDCIFFIRIISIDYSRENIVLGLLRQSSGKVNLNFVISISYLFFPMEGSPYHTVCYYMQLVQFIWFHHCGIQGVLSYILMKW